MSNIMCSFQNNDMHTHKFEQVKYQMEMVVLILSVLDYFSTIMLLISLLCDTLGTKKNKNAVCSLFDRTECCCNPSSHVVAEVLRDRQHHAKAFLDFVKVRCKKKTKIFCKQIFEKFVTTTTKKLQKKVTQLLEITTKTEKITKLLANLQPKNGEKSSKIVS